MARYVIRATDDTGAVQFEERLAIDAALQRAIELRDAHFRHITIVNTQTGVEITDLEALIVERADVQTQAKRPAS